MPPREEQAGVAIVGAGPVGLSLALGLARQGIRSVVLEKEDSTSEQSRAPGIHVRTREIFRQWGVENRVMEAGTLVSDLALHSAIPGREPLLALDFGDLDAEADRPGILVLEQGETERILLEAVRGTGMVDTRFGAEVVGLREGRDGVILTVTDAAARNGEAYEERAPFVVGCDGAGSFVRKALGLPFDGVTYAMRPILADVRIFDERDALPWPRVRNSREGFSFALRLRPGMWRLVRLGRGSGDADDARENREPPASEVEAIVQDVLGPGSVEHVWSSRFRIHRRSAPTYRVGRVLLAGDAAHLQSPAGGMGMNAGIQDAHNLAWKLASVLKGGDADRLLESYDAERRPVVGTVSRYTDLVTRLALQTPPAIRSAVFLLWGAALGVAPLRRAALRRTAMIDLGYGASPLLRRGISAAGRRLPNPVLQDGGAPPGSPGVRLHDLLPDAAAILSVGEDRELPAGLPVQAVIRIGGGGFRDPSGVISGLVPGGRGWILIRPDRHVGWSGTDPDAVPAAVGWALGASGGG
ncbi:MAG: FAD-dependent oxidoreductase [Gemmatimonadales bacterium]|nr:MAG: FAD-dependent oxidoreductase [Gemmatimonadales bacterium]